MPRARLPSMLLVCLASQVLLAPARGAAAPLPFEVRSAIWARGPDGLLVVVASDHPDLCAAYSTETMRPDVTLMGWQFVQIQNGQRRDPDAGDYAVTHPEKVPGVHGGGSSASGAFVAGGFSHLDGQCRTYQAHTGISGSARVLFAWTYLGLSMQFVTAPHDDTYEAQLIAQPCPAFFEHGFSRCVDEAHERVSDSRSRQSPPCVNSDAAGCRQLGG